MPSILQITFRSPRRVATDWQWGQDLKITLIIDCLHGPTAGTEQQFLTLAEALHSRGHHVELVVLRETAYTNNLYDGSLKITCLGIDSILTLHAIRKLWQFRRLAVANQVDVVHGFFSDVAITLPVVFLGSGVKIFTSRRDMGIWYTRLKLVLSRIVALLPTRVICNCHAVAQYTIKREWLSGDKVEVIYNGVAIQQPNTDDDIPPWLNTFTDSQQIFHVATMCNIRPVKRVEDLILAAADICSTSDGIRFSVIGEPLDKDYYAQLKIMVAELNLEDRFHLIGKVSSPASVMPYVDLGVSCSTSEGLSNSIIEFLASGTPVIASNVGGTPELVSNGNNGFLYDVGDVRLLALQIRRLHTDRELYDRMAAAAKASIQNLSVENMVEAHINAYRRN